MELSFRSGRTGLLLNRLLTFLFSMVLGTSLAFAGGMPPDARKEASTMEQDVEIKEPAPEVKEEPVAEPSADATFTDETVEEVSEAQEDRNRGFTVGVRGALSVLDSESMSRAAIPPYGPLEATVDYDQGYNLSLMLGYALGNGLRFEAEATYIENAFQKINVKTPGAFAAQLETGEKNLEGDVSAKILMMNAYYDINMGGNLVPYIGGGLGAAELMSEMKSADNLLVDAADCFVAYQVGAGLGYKISGYSNGPDITLSLDYRYLASLKGTRLKQKVTNHFVEGEFGGHYMGGGIRLGLW